MQLFVAWEEYSYCDLHFPYSRNRFHWHNLTILDFRLNTTQNEFYWIYDSKEIYIQDKSKQLWVSLKHGVRNFLFMNWRFHKISALEIESSSTTSVCHCHRTYRTPYSSMKWVIKCIVLCVNITCFRIYKNPFILFSNQYSSFCLLSMSSDGYLLVSCIRGVEFAGDRRNKILVRLVFCRYELGPIRRRGTKVFVY